METKNITQLTELVQQAEHYRDEASIVALQEYAEQRPGLFSETKTIGNEIEETVLQYLSSGNELKKLQIQNDLEALRQELMEGDDVIHYLLASEIITSYLLYQFGLTKLIRHYGYSGSAETRKVSSLQSCFLRSLKEYKKITGRIPEINFNQFNQNIYQRS